MPARLDAMGAGSSTRKVQLQAEVKLREEAERRAQAETEARKRLEEELASAVRELQRLRAAVPQAGECVRVWGGWVGGWAGG